MNKHSIAINVLGAAIGLATAPVMAADLRIDGFASVVYGQVLDKDELGGGDFLGYDEKANFQNESLYGVQFRSDLTEGLTATGQIVGQGNTDFDARVTWAYFAYEATQNLTIKAGRQRVPLFLYADFLAVGYAYTWVTPPAEFYDLSGFENLDGINFEYASELGPWSSRLNLLYGASSTTVSSGNSTNTIDTNDSIILTWNMSWEWLTLQMAYNGSHTTVEAYGQLAAGLSAVAAGAGPPFTLTPEEENVLAFDNDKTEYYQFGASADWGTWLAAAEYAHVKGDNTPVAGERDTWYVMGGFRWDAFTFALTYAAFDNPNVEEAIGAIDRLSPILSADPTNRELLALQAGANAAYRLGEESETITLTMRYDFHPSAAFKVEYLQNSSDLDNNPSGAITKLEPSLIRMAVDLVF